MNCPVLEFAINDKWQVTCNSEPVKLPTPCWSRILPSAGALQLAKTAHTTQAQDIGDSRVAVGPVGVLVAYHGISAMVITKNHNNSGPATEESVFCFKKPTTAKHCHHKLLIWPLLLPRQEDCPLSAHQREWRSSDSQEQLLLHGGSSANAGFRFKREEKQFAGLPGWSPVFEGKKTGEGGGGHQAVQSTLDLVVNEKFRLLSAHVVMI